MVTKNILIVEDEPIVAQDLNRILTKLGYNVVGPCNTGSHAIKIALESKLDAALVDIHLLDELDGVDVALKINEIAPLPVIFITAYADDETVLKASQAQPYGYVVKPFDDHQIQIALTIALSKFKNDNVLRSKEEHFRKLISYSSDITTILNTDSSILYISDSCENILGYTSEHLTGNKLYEFIHPEDIGFVSDYISKQNNSNSAKVLVQPYRFRHIDGSWVFLESLGKNFTQNNFIQGIIFNSRDVTERKLTEEKMISYLEQVVTSKNVLQETTSELFVLNQKLIKIESELREEILSKDKFFAIISHDLRSPFGNVLKLAEYLLKNIRTLSTEDIYEIANDIHESGCVVFELLENLLQWARIESGKMNVSPTIIDFSQTADHIYEIFKPIAETKGVILNIEDTTDCKVFADTNMLFSAIQNLISNAIKFTPKGGKVSLSTKTNDINVTIKVTDTGIGMSEDELSKLFHRAYHFTQTGTNGEQGAGLGLILSKELIEKNNGSLHVESTKAKGTIFTVTLPASQPIITNT
ncbi:MAG: PAS domain S-box protein [Bacteroidetes bacterium]|nr:PAS domain S-box protein [Bacteroidota bacterium]